MQCQRNVKTFTQKLRIKINAKAVLHVHSLSERMNHVEIRAGNLND